MGIHVFCFGIISGIVGTPASIRTAEAAAGAAQAGRSATGSDAGSTYAAAPRAHADERCAAIVDLPNCGGVAGRRLPRERRRPPPLRLRHRVLLRRRAVQPVVRCARPCKQQTALRRLDQQLERVARRRVEEAYAVAGREG